MCQFYLFWIKLREKKFSFKSNGKLSARDNVTFGLEGTENGFVCLSIKYTQRNLFEILLNQTEIRLYLLFSDWFGTAKQHPNSISLVPNHSENGKYNLISVWFNKICLCVLSHSTNCRFSWRAQQMQSHKQKLFFCSERKKYSSKMINRNFAVAVHLAIFTHFSSYFVYI